MILLSVSMNWLWSKSPEWWVAFGTLLLAVATFVLALVTAFQDRIRARLFRPRLSLKMESQPTCAEKNRWENGVDVYWFMAEVSNGGEIEARNVQLYLADLRYQTASPGVYAPIDRFSPMKLKWAHYHTPTLEILVPGIPWRCGFFHIADPAKKSLTNEHTRDAGSNEPVLALDLEVPDIMVRHYLPKGDYRATLRLGASNHPPIEYTVKFSFKGLWFDDENRMFQEGVGIEQPGLNERRKEMPGRAFR